VSSLVSSDNGSSNAAAAKAKASGSGDPLTGPSASGTGKRFYQYVVHYEPPIDSQYHRIKLLYQLSEITGQRLFDGYVLFLPILLPDKITALKVKRKTTHWYLKFKKKKRINFFFSIELHKSQLT